MKCAVCGTQHSREVESCGSCDLPLHPEGTPLPIIVGRYEMRSFLGKGGMGSVFEAWDNVLEEAVAIKVLRRNIEDLESMTRRFRSEIRIARRVRHPNVCAIHEYGEDESLSYIAMELVQGENLKRILQRGGALAGEKVFDVALQLAAGLQAIHEVGVVHRDLKSSNVMLDRNGRLRLMDFGIAKEYGAAESGITMAGQIIGTPEYMSPEQAQGEPLDFRSDIYAAGIILFEIFTGRVPFHAETPIATLYKQVQEPPPLDQPLAKWLPDDLKALLRRALAKHRSDRYQSATELREAVRAAAAVRLGGLSADVPVTAALPGPHTARKPRLSPEPEPPTADLPSAAQPPGAATAGRQTPESIPASPRPPQPTPGSGPSPRTGAPPYQHDHGPTPQPAAIRLGPVVGVGLLAILGLAVGVAVLLRLGSQSGETRPSVVAQGGGGALGGPIPSNGEPEDAEDAEDPEASPPEEEASPSPGGVEAPAPLSPTRTATPTPKATPPPSPTPAATPTPRTTPAPAPAVLQVRVRPWAEVEVDGEVVGTTPFKPVGLAPGRHRVVLRHPDYEPVQRIKELASGETWELRIDMKLDAIAKQR